MTRPFTTGIREGFIEALIRLPIIFLVMLFFKYIGIMEVFDLPSLSVLQSLGVAVILVGTSK